MRPHYLHGTNPVRTQPKQNGTVSRAAANERSIRRTIFRSIIILLVNKIYLHALYILANETFANYFLVFLRAPNKTSCGFILYCIACAYTLAESFCNVTTKTVTSVRCFVTAAKFEIVCQNTCTACYVKSEDLNRLNG